jgi:plasmid stabilization system protein ParE
LATLRFTPLALRDLERLVRFLKDSDPHAARATIPLIIDGIRILASFPLIGRPLDENRRELLVYRGRTGYLVQYAFRQPEDEVLVLAVRHQREVDG